MVRVLDELSRTNIKRFKSKLNDVRFGDFDRNIGKGPLDKAVANIDLADLIIGHYGKLDGLRIVIKVLKDINQVHLSTKLSEETISGIEESFSFDPVGASTPDTTPEADVEVPVPVPVQKNKKRKRNRRLCYKSKYSNTGKRCKLKKRGKRLLDENTESSEGSEHHEIQQSSDESIMKGILSAVNTLSKLKVQITSDTLGELLQFAKSVRGEGLNSIEMFEDKHIEQVLLSLSGVIKEEIQEAVRLSPVFSVQAYKEIIGGRQWVILYVSYLKDGQVKTSFLSICSFEDACSIKNFIDQILQEKGFEYHEKLAAFLSDGEPVMCRVAELLKQDCPCLISHHCGYRYAILPAFYACETMKPMEKFKETVSQIFTFYSTSNGRFSNILGIKLLRNGEEIAGPQQSDVAFHQDWPFHLTKSVAFTPAAGRGDYSCRVEHSTLTGD
ncbi:Beta-2-microglobulin [Acipenser ruthenus]|uniref:Beta-2-microglobulin n=1 Tax=Acipenser ruthenus TaxID=7906 RepID=A0A662YME6_ACIRT|nr:Beta-2-microglobulin [Acipenser ruthenus]